MSLIEHSFHPFISALAWTIIHSLWQFALILLLVKLARALSGKTNTNFSYIINLIGLITIPIIFAITLIRQYNIYNQARMIVSVEFEDASRLITTGDSNIFLIERSLPAFFNRLEAFTPAICWIYIAGLLAFSLYGFYGYLQVNAIKRRNTIALPESWSRQVSGIKNKAKVLKQIRVFASKHVQIPVVLGVFKPVILLPLTMFTALSPEQIETILLHELRHIHNKDQYINILQNVLEILFFYHPAVWMISKQLSQEREKRVDEWVVHHTKAPLIYAQALFTLEKSRHGAMQPALAAVQSKNQLFIRIKNIMTMKTKNWNTGRNLAALMIIMTSAFALTFFDPDSSLKASARYDNLSFTSELYTEGYQPPQQTKSTLHAVSDASHDDQIAANDTSEVEPPKQPKIVVLDDGTTVTWDDMSAKDQDELQKAMKEMRLKVAEINLELVELFQSDEFKEQMHKAGEETQRALEKAHLEFNTFVDLGAFQQEMSQAQVEIEKATKELEAVNWAGVEENLKEAMEEVEKAMHNMEPQIEDMMRDLQIEEVIQEAMDSVKKAIEEAEKQKETE